MASLFPRWPGLRLLTGSTMFNLASGCYTITLGQALFEKSGSVSAFTGIVVIEYIVPVILGALAGSMADRINPAVVCAVASIIPALSLIAYLVAPAGVLVVAGVAIGLVINLVRPFYRAGIFAVGPRSLDPADLPRYNMRWTVSVQAGQIVGGAVAGVFLWAAGPKWAFLAAAVAYAMAAYALASARSAMSTTPDEDGATDDTGWGSVLREAISSTRSVLSLLLLGVDFLTIAAFNVALAPLVHRLYGNESWLGILDVCFAAGAVVAPALWARCSSASTRQAVTSGFAIQIAGFATIALGDRIGWHRRAVGCAIGRGPPWARRGGVVEPASEHPSNLGEVIHDRQGRCAPASGNRPHDGGDPASGWTHGRHRSRSGLRDRGWRARIGDHRECRRRQPREDDRGKR